MSGIIVKKTECFTKKKIYLAIEPSSNRKTKPKPYTRCDGGRKFFFPRTIKAPVVRYSPACAVLLTWSPHTHHADVTTFSSHARLVGAGQCLIKEGNSLFPWRIFHLNFSIYFKISHLPDALIPSYIHPHPYHSNAHNHPHTYPKKSTHTHTSAYTNYPLG